MQRRRFVLGGMGLAAAAGLRPASAQTPWDSDEGAPFDVSMVRQVARQLAQSPFKAPNDSLPAELKDAVRHSLHEEIDDRLVACQGVTQHL